MEVTFFRCPAQDCIVSKFDQNDPNFDTQCQCYYLMHSSQDYRQEDVSDENSSDELLSTFDSYITQIKQDHLRTSKTRNPHTLSDATVPTISPSLESSPSI